MGGGAERAAGRAGARRVVLWFRGTDLRVHDSAPVARAAQLARAAGAAGAEVLPVFCFDPRQFGVTRFGSPKTGAFRAQFLRKSVECLRESLEGLGSGLLVYHGRPESVLPSLVHPQLDTTVLAQREVTSEERKVERAVLSGVSERGGSLEMLWGSTMYHLDDLPYDDVERIPDVFTPFRKKVEERCAVRKVLPTPGKGELPFFGEGSGAEHAEAAARMPSLAELYAELPPGLSPQKVQEGAEARGVLEFRGGERAALARLRHYLWDTDSIATYFETRNGMLGGDYSTKFSPWLALGCLSARQVFWEVDRYQQKRKSNKSTYWVLFELLWRDYFRFFAMKHGRKIFLEGGMVGRGTWSADPVAVQRWKDGQTGRPLVDACMRELAATGFMSNRGRQNVASYLALDLGIDWRIGGDHFESLLLDYDVTSNWGNWVAAAGLTGGRVNKFNITKQSKDYDADGAFVKHWCPELRNVPAPLVYEPWKMTAEQQSKYGCIIGKDYPSPQKTRGFDRPGGGGGPGRGRRPSGKPQGRQGGGNGRDNQRKISSYMSKKKSNFEMYG